MTARRLPGVATSLVLLATLSGAPLHAQKSIGVGADYLRYTFDEGLGPDAAQLFIIPVAVRLPVTDALTLDAYSAWADGRVDVADTVYKLTGLVDTGVRAAYQVTPWALATLGANIPTGNATHDGDEAIVASVLSTDLLGFREATWGRGFALTGSLAVGRTVGNWGLGLAGAYSMRGKFNPSEEQSDLEYQPGSEARVRLGLDRNFGNSTVTVGATFINYAEDQADGRNLFQAGNRFRLDATYAFRMGAGVWTLYAADLVRSNGTLNLPMVDDQGLPLESFSEFKTPKQNLFVGGFMGAISLGSGFVFRPHFDFKLQSREDVTGSDAESGWLLGVGGDVPIRVFGGQDFFPEARVLFGSIKDATGTGIGVFGLELKGTMRVGL